MILMFSLKFLYVTFILERYIQIKFIGMISDIDPGGTPGYHYKTRVTDIKCSLFKELHQAANKPVLFRSYHYIQCLIRLFSQALYTAYSFYKSLDALVLLIAFHSLQLIK